MNYECLLCQLRSLQHRIEKYQVPEEKRNILVRELLFTIAEIDIGKSYSPEITRNILSRLKTYSPTDDPYRDEKYISNNLMLNRYSEFKAIVNTSADPFNTALRLAIAGNIIDFGPSQKFNIDGAIDKVLTSDFAIDHSQQLLDQINNAKTILYLGDNSGEIVLDKLLLETIGHSNVFFAVREKPVLNDATTMEAEEAGINDVAQIITNGDDIPGTLLHRVSPGFKKIFQSADLIISKGMGNYEGLMFERDPRLFFLLMVKCRVIGKKIGAPYGEFVVKRQYLR